MVFRVRYCAAFSTSPFSLESVKSARWQMRASRVRGLIGPYCPWWAVTTCTSSSGKFLRTSSAVARDRWSRYSAKGAELKLPFSFLVYVVALKMSWSKMPAMTRSRFTLPW